MRMCINLRYSFAALIAFVAIAPPAVVSAKNQMEWDLDSMAYQSDEIDEVQVLQGWEEAMGVQIMRCFLGGSSPGTVINIPKIEDGWRVTRLPFAPTHFEAGDRLFVFLEHSRLIPNGEMLIVRGNVSAVDEADLRLKLPVSTVAPEDWQELAAARYRDAIRSSIVKAAELRHRFSVPPSARDIPWLLSLIKERASHRDPYGSDAILNAAHRRPLEVGNFQAWKRPR